MTISDLKSKLVREPFRQFVIELASGRQILIEADSELFFPKARPELVIAFTADGTMYEFEENVLKSIE